MQNISWSFGFFAIISPIYQGSTAFKLVTFILVPLENYYSVNPKNPEDLKSTHELAVLER